MIDKLFECVVTGLSIDNSKNIFFGQSIFCCRFCCCVGWLMVVWVLSLVGMLVVVLGLGCCGFGGVWVMFMVNWRSVGKP